MAAGQICTDPTTGKILADDQGRIIMYDPTAPDCECGEGDEVACVFARMQYFGAHRTTVEYSCGSVVEISEATSIPGGNGFLFPRAVPNGCPFTPDIVPQRDLNNYSPSFDNWAASSVFNTCPPSGTTQQCDDFIYNEIPVFPQYARLLVLGGVYRVVGSATIVVQKSPYAVYAGEVREDCSPFACVAEICEGECADIPDSQWFSMYQISPYGQLVNCTPPPQSEPCMFTPQYAAIGSVRFTWSLSALFDPGSDLQFDPLGFARVRRSRVTGVNISVTIPEITAVTHRTVLPVPSKVTDSFFIGAKSHNPAIIDGPTSRAFEVYRTSISSRTGTYCDGTSDDQYNELEELLTYGNIAVFD